MRRGSLQLLSVRGIPIRLHWSFLLFFPIFVGMLSVGYGQSFLWGAIAYLLIFACVALHELTHSLVAQRYGLTVREIILIPLGGVAMLDQIPEDPKKEAAIAIAGPVFNVVVAGLLYAFMYWVPAIEFYPWRLEPNTGAFEKAVVFIFLINLLIAGFNLIPAFPTDGGRLLRAGLVALGAGYLKATRAAVLVSRIILVGFIIIGILPPFNPIILLIALLLFMGGSSEEANVRTRSALKHLKAGHLLPQEPIAVEPDTRLSEIVPLILESRQKHFPVIRRGRLTGLVCHPDLMAALSRPGGAERKVSEIMVVPPLVKPGEPLAEVKQKLERQNAAAGLILENGRLAGIVSQDQLRQLAGMLEAHD